MRRWAGPVAMFAAAVALAGCGSVSLAQATKGWENSSSFTKNVKTLASEVKSSQGALRDHLAAVDLHTVCEVLFTDATAANSSLPTPDQQLTSLLHRGYVLLGQGAATCYGAFGSATKTNAAIQQMEQGVSELSLAIVRLNVVTGS